MDMKEMIEELNELTRGNYLNVGGCRIAGDVVMLSAVMGVVNEYKESNTPVLPKYVAKWLEDAKYNGLSLYGAMSDAKIRALGTEEDVELLSLYFLDSSNQNSFALAWVTGDYKVKERKRYTLESTNHNLKGYYLVFNILHDRYDLRHFSELDNEYLKYRFTEKELEDIDVKGFKRELVEEVE